MDISSAKKRTILFTSAMLLLAGSTNATDYKFRVSCAAKRSVAEWNTGDIDPGREFLRVVTGLDNPNCSISDFNPEMDGRLPIERFSDWGAILKGTLSVFKILQWSRPGGT
ncbi:hypothetical protein [Rhizobium hainanense]|uniref:Uncharacterized protein n=1 Tax=Rhizobium hainanense TaxID=52131 RepID=A0A1C3WC34_9HYPH|nr:hypothetical protein [Rhizobium hainanense]SCB37481.1 hypothetical protein GA0061100_11514 [Rhizobium hainanense]